MSSQINCIWGCHSRLAWLQSIYSNASTPLMIKLPTNCTLCCSWLEDVQRSTQTILISCNARTPNRSAQTATPRSDSHHRVCVHKHTFGVVCERPAVELSEGHSQVWSLHHDQVRGVPTVQHVHQPDLIIQRLKHCPEQDEKLWSTPHWYLSLAPWLGKPNHHYHHHHHRVHC